MFDIIFFSTDVPTNYILIQYIFIYEIKKWYLLSSEIVLFQNLEF